MTQKVAVITGGATGIGKSTAMLLASKGIKVVISGRREAVGQKAVEEIRAQGGDAAFIAADVDNETQVRQMIGFAVRKYGRLDLAVNNAGISNETKTIEDSDPREISGDATDQCDGCLPLYEVRNPADAEERRQLDCESRVNRWAQ